MKILICGFMGAGKTTLVKKCQRNDFSFECIDLDNALALDQGIRPDQLGEWIIKNGFPLFRDLEQAKLRILLTSKNSLVIALGGGTLNSELLQIIKSEGDNKLVFLDVSFETCWSRIKNDKTRPMSQIPQEELKKLFALRRNDYLLADLIINENDIKEIEGFDSLMHNLKRS